MFSSFKLPGAKARRGVITPTIHGNEDLDYPELYYNSLN
jgi:hypothetical protein